MEGALNGWLWGGQRSNVDYISVPGYFFALDRFGGTGGAKRQSPLHPGDIHRVTNQPFDYAAIADLHYKRLRPSKSVHPYRVLPKRYRMDSFAS